MGGTLIRLCDHGHEVHVAYQTSGNIAVFDDDVVRALDLSLDLAQLNHAATSSLTDWVRDAKAALARANSTIGWSCQECVSLHFGSG